MAIRKTFTKKELEALPSKNITSKKLVDLMVKFMQIPREETQRKVDKLENGTYIGVHQLENGKRVKLYLKKYWVKEFNFAYSLHSKIKSGKELLMANIPLPAGDPFKYK